jgi:hypothetical protein
MTIVVHPQRSGLTEPAAPKKPPAPKLSPEVLALLSTAGCKVSWTGHMWAVIRNLKIYHCNGKLTSFPDWEATVKAIVEATG